MENDLEVFLCKLKEKILDLEKSSVNNYLVMSEKLSILSIFSKSIDSLSNILTKIESTIGEFSVTGEEILDRIYSLENRIEHAIFRINKLRKEDE